MTMLFSEKDVGTLVGTFSGGSCEETSSRGGLDGVVSFGRDLRRDELCPISESDDEEPRLERGVKKWLSSKVRLDLLCR